MPFSAWPPQAHGTLLKRRQLVHRYLLSNVILLILLGQQVLGLTSAAAISGVVRFQDSLSSQQPQPFRRTEKERIPKILHQVFLSGKEELHAVAAKKDPLMRMEWSQNCALHHEGWQVMFWDMPAALQLLRQDYPWFLQTFQSYQRLVQQGDAIRYFILNSYGGVYMDMDVECFRAIDRFLDGFDLVLNREYHQNLIVTNAVMASSPHLDFWQDVFHTMQSRSDWKNDQLDLEVVSTSGPFMLTDVFSSYSHNETGFPGQYIHLRTPKKRMGFPLRRQKDAWRNEEVIKLYEVGTWYTPCIFDEEQCHTDLIEAKQNGTLDLKNLAGYHRYQGTWKPCQGECFRSQEHRTKGEQDPLQGGALLEAADAGLQ